MGFGRGKGFTSKARTEMVKVSVKGGGGAARITKTETNPAVTTSVS